MDLETGASDDEIRSAYRLLAQVWHPDRFQANQKLRTAAEEKLKEINRAYQYLTSPEGRSARCTGDTGSAARVDWEPASSAAAPPPSYEAVSPEPERRAGPEESPRPRNRFKLPFGILLRYCVILLCAAVAGVLVLHWLDSYLSSNPDTAAFYGETKARVSADAAATWGETWDRVRRSLRLAPAASAAPSAATSSENRPEAEAPRGQVRHAASPSQATVVKIRPYITAGLTEEEVEKVQGPPSEATETKLVYDRSELYFRADHLVGWKIDPSTPLRVKLWPDSLVDPDLRAFTVGSSKDEVLAVQGTPSLFSEDKFGYGGSEVYFEKGRVVGWRNDPATAPLRVTGR